MRALMSVVVAFFFLAAAPALAEKPDRAGKGKSAEKQRQTMDSEADDQGVEMKEEAKVESEKKEKKAVDFGEGAEEAVKAEEPPEVDKDVYDEESEKGRKQMKGRRHQGEATEKRGLEKQREKKGGQVLKESDKGSEEGQEARENRQKWWKFWE